MIKSDSFKTAAYLAVREVMKIIGVDPDENEITLKNCTTLLMCFWSSDFEKDDKDKQCPIAHRWVVSTIASMTSKRGVIDLHMRAAAVENLIEHRKRMSAKS